MQILRGFPAVLLIVVAVVGTLAVLHPDRTLAAPSVVVFNVNSTLDEIDDNTSDGNCHTASGGPAQGRCTLRAAVMQANKITGPGVDIIVPSGIYTLTRPPDVNNFDDTGDLNLHAPVSGNPLISIIGSGVGSTIIDGRQQDRIFRVESGRAALIRALTVRNGYLGAGGSYGGGIFNDGVLSLNEITVFKNHSEQYGGGIYNVGALSIYNSTLEENSVAISGGGIYVGADATISQSLIYNNSAYYGAGVFNEAVTALINTTVSVNNARSNGGGIYNYNGTTNVYNGSVIFNQADSDLTYDAQAGGFYNSPGKTVGMRNSILAGNYYSGAPVYNDCYGPLLVAGSNAFTQGGDLSNCTITGVPGAYSFYLNALNLIGPLSNNGGATRTHALLKGSNAIDGGDSSQGCVGPSGALLPTDQRGARRTVDGDANGFAYCDVGAYEYQPPLYLPLLRR